MFSARQAYKDTAATALAAALVFGISTNASAAPIAVGDCGPADTIKTQLRNEGYDNYFAYDVELFDNTKNSVVKTRASIYSNDGMKKGFDVERAGANNELLCVRAALSDIIIADSDAQAAAKQIDPRFLRNLPKSDEKGGINHTIRFAANKVGFFPVVQAKLTQKNGGQGYLTIEANSQTHEGGRLYSDFSGVVVDSSSRLEIGKAPMTGFSPVAREVLAQAKSTGGKREAPGR